jgi:hypothetical protein
MRAAAPPEGIGGTASEVPATSSRRERAGIWPALARSVTPARASACVAVAATAGLAASQFVDYRAVAIGAPDYHGVAGVAPPPELAAATPRSAHGEWVLVICGLAIVVLVATAAVRRPQVARHLVLLGAAAVAIALAVDRPRGLDVGRTGVAYQAAHAVLLGGFGAEIAAAAALAVAGFALPLGHPATRRPPAPRGPTRSGARPTRAAPLQPGRGGE